MTKKVLLAFFLTLGTTFYSHSQFMNGWLCYDCYSSIEVGVISSNISGMDGASQKFGFYIGFYQYAEMSHSFSLRYGTSYNNIGAKIEGHNSPLVIHSLNFPLSLHYTYDYKFQFFGGGELGTNMFGKLPTTDNYDPYESMWDFHETLTFMDASVFLGGGVILMEVIDINLRYNLGVTNVSKHPDFDWRKNWLTLSLGYTWR